LFSLVKFAFIIIVFCYQYSNVRFIITFDKLFLKKILLLVYINY